MVTLIKYGALSGGEKYNINVLSIDGLSTDTKPTVTYIEYGSDGREVSRMGIPNGSIFTEIDTGNTYMYDAYNTTWYRVTIGGGGGGGGGFTPTTAQLDAMNSGINSTKVAQITTNENNISKQQDTVASGGNGYALVNGIRVYVSATAPTDDIPDGSIWIGG